MWTLQSSQFMALREFPGCGTVRGIPGRHGDFPELSCGNRAETPGKLSQLGFAEQSSGKDDGLGREPRDLQSVAVKYSLEN